MIHHPLAGVYAAALTPLKPDYSFDPEGLDQLLNFLHHRGCHGALLLGTTGEGPSFSPGERQAIIQSAANIRQDLPGFRLFAGTGTPSLEETIALTKAAFDSGFEGVVVVPPYYFRGAGDEGLFLWFSEVLERSVPPGKALFGYHIPRVSGVSLSFDLLARLKEAFPKRFAGLKDSSAEPDFARKLGEQFGSDLLILNGTDRLFSEALQYGAGGCITALANLISKDLRGVWDSHLAGKTNPVVQARLNAARAVLERYPPAAPLLKALLAELHGFPLWVVKPPLVPLSDLLFERALLDWKTRGQMAY